MAYETEELWFDEWEHGGHPYYEAPAEFEKWNPVNFVQNWKTPQLVDHQREGLPNSLHAGDRGLHRAPAPQHPVAAADLPGREPLGAEAEELGSVVRRGLRLDAPWLGEGAPVPSAPARAAADSRAGRSSCEARGIPDNWMPLRSHERTAVDAAPPHR